MINYFCCATKSIGLASIEMEIWQGGQKKRCGAAFWTCHVSAAGLRWDLRPGVVVVQSLSCIRLLQPHGLQLARLLCPWDSTGKNTEVGCHFLLQGIFSIQESNPGLLTCRKILYRLSYERRSQYLEQAVEYMTLKLIGKVQAENIKFESAY